MKKKFAGITFVLLCMMCSMCSNPEKMIEKYLQDHEQILNSLEFIEVSEIDSMYSPFNELRELTIRYAETSSKISKYINQAWHSHSEKECLIYLDSAYNHSKIETAFLDSIATDYFEAVDFPSLCLENPNYRAVKAKYRINGILKEDYFYFERNEKNSIGHSSIDNKRYCREIIEYLREIREKEREIPDKKRNVRNGLYRFNKY